MKGKSDYMLEMFSVKYGPDSFYGKLHHANQEADKHYQYYRRGMIISACSAFIICFSAVISAQYGYKIIGIISFVFGASQYIIYCAYSLKKWDQILEEEHNKIPKMEFNHK